MSETFCNGFFLGVIKWSVTPHTTAQMVTDFHGMDSLNTKGDQTMKKIFVNGKWYYLTDAGFESANRWAWCDDFANPLWADGNRSWRTSQSAVIAVSAEFGSDKIVPTTIEAEHEGVPAEAFRTETSTVTA